MTLSLEQLAALRNERALRRSGELQAAERRVAEQRTEHGHESQFLQRYIAVAHSALHEQQALTAEAERRLGVHKAEESRLHGELCAAYAELSSEQAALQASRAAGLAAQAGLEQLRARAGAGLQALHGRLAAEHSGALAAARHTDELLRAIAVERGELAAEAHAALQAQEGRVAMFAAGQVLQAKVFECGEDLEASLRSLEMQATEHQRLAERARTLLEADKAQHLLERQEYERRSLAQRYTRECSGAHARGPGMPLLQRLAAAV